MPPAPRAGGAFAGTKARGLIADAKKTAAKDETEDLDLGKDAKSGEAHKLWANFTKAKNGKKVGKTTITKSDLKDMIYMLQQAQRISFVSLGKLQDFVDREFSASDGDGNGRMDFNEFFAFYGRWLNHDADAIHRRLLSTMDEVEACFLQADANADMSLDKDELLAICKARTPPGLPPPDDDKLIALIEELLKEYDTNGDGACAHSRPPSPAPLHSQPSVLVPLVHRRPIPVRRVRRGLQHDGRALVRDARGDTQGDAAPAGIYYGHSRR